VCLFLTHIAYAAPNFNFSYSILHVTRLVCSHVWYQYRYRIAPQSIGIMLSATYCYRSFTISYWVLVLQWKSCERTQRTLLLHTGKTSNLTYHVSTVESTMSVKVLLRKSDLGFHCYVVNILLTSAAWSCWGKCWSLIFILFSCIHLLQFISSVNLQCSVGEECGLQHICVSLQRLLGNDLSMANHGEPGKCPLKCLCR